jgi:hypothetical protein
LIRGFKWIARIVGDFLKNGTPRTASLSKKETDAIPTSFVVGSPSIHHVA